MGKHTKIAVSVPTDTYEAVEKARERLGCSRSEVVAAALREWLQGLEADAARKRYVAGYLRLPESGGELDDATRMAAVATADWSSWERAKPSRASERGGKRR